MTLLEIRHEGEGRTEPPVGIHEIHSGLDKYTITAYGTNFKYWLIDGVELAYAKITLKMDRDRLATVYFGVTEQTQFNMLPIFILIILILAGLWMVKRNGKKRRK